MEKGKELLGALIRADEYNELETGHSFVAEAADLLPEHESRQHYIMKKGLFGIDREPVSVMRYPVSMEVYAHSHDFFEVQYVARGEVLQTINGKPVSLDPGSVTVFNKHTVHVIHPSGPDAQMFFIFIDEQLLDSRLFSLLSSDDILAQYLYRSVAGYETRGDYLLYRHADEILGNLVWNLYAEGRYRLPDYRRLNYLHFAELLVRLGRHGRTSRAELAAKRKAPAGMRRLNQVEEYIRSNPQQASLSEAAAAAHMHRNSLCRLIKEIAGTTFTGLVRDIRLELAEYLLISTDLSVESVAAEVGYANSAHFYNLFKKKYGRTPGRHRAKYLERIQDEVGEAG